MIFQELDVSFTITTFASAQNLKRRIRGECLRWKRLLKIFTFEESIREVGSLDGFLPLIAFNHFPSPSYYFKTNMFLEQKKSRFAPNVISLKRACSGSNYLDCNYKRKRVEHFYTSKILLKRKTLICEKQRFTWVFMAVIGYYHSSFGRI